MNQPAPGMVVALLLASLAASAGLLALVRAVVARWAGDDGTALLNLVSVVVGPGLIYWTARRWRHPAG